MPRNIPRWQRSYPMSVPLFITGLVAAAVVGSLLSAEATTVTAPWWAMLVLLTTMVAGAFLHVDVRHGNEVDAIDLFESALAPVIFVLAGPVAVGLAAVAKGIAEIGLRIPPLKAVFNVAQWAAAAAVGSVMLAALAPVSRSAADLPALAIAMVAVMAVNQAAFVAVLCLAEGRPLRRIGRELRPMILPVWVVGSTVNLAVGLLFAAAFVLSPGIAPLFVVVLGALHLGSRGYAATLADRARLEGLQRATRALAVSAASDAATRTFLSEAAACFGAPVVELLVVEEGAEATLYRVDADTFERHRPAPERNLAAAVLERGQRVLATDDDADRTYAELLRELGHRDVVAVPVHRGGDISAVLCVYDRQGVHAQPSGEVAVLEALAGEIGQALDRWRLHAALRNSEERFRRLVQRSSDMLTIVDADGIVRYVSPAVERLLDREERDMVGQPLAAFVHSEDVAAVNAALRAARTAPDSGVSVSHRGLTAERTSRPLDTVVSNLLEERQIAGFVLHSRDATDRRRVELLLAGQAEILEAIACDAPLKDVLGHIARHLEAHCSGARAAVVVSHGGRHLAVDPVPHVSRAVLSTLDDPGADWPTRPSSVADNLVVVPDVDGELVNPRVAAAARDEGFRSLWVLRTDAEEGFAGTVAVYHPGRRRPGSSDRRVIEQAAHLAHIAMQRVRSRERLLHQATRDPLTGLPNRALFLDRARGALDRAYRRPATVAVLFIDLDRFKIVNDSLGHDAGDRLLIALSRRLSSVMRSPDTIARFGGDEFTMLCEELEDEAQAMAIAERVNRALQEPVLIDGRELFVTASVGVAVASGPDNRPEALLENADTAMYRAKERGGGRCEIFHEGMRTASQNQLATHSALHRGVERGEFCVFYQPVVSLLTGRVVGAEALVRWRHPRRGLLGPASFIHSAEDTGLIVPIGAHVLREACSQARRWQAMDRRGLAMSVNLSARQFSDPQLIHLVTEVIDAAGVDPESIALEITETTLMEDAVATSAALHGLKTLGVRLIIDDFGTGYSSLDYLSRFPVDGLKVDRSFVRGLGGDGAPGTNSSSRAIVATIIHLAHTLGLSAIAEGVEDATQLAVLRELGCEGGQGYLFSPPVPADDLELGVVRTH